MWKDEGVKGNSENGQGEKGSEVPAREGPAHTHPSEQHGGVGERRWRRRGLSKGGDNKGIPEHGDSCLRASFI